MGAALPLDQRRRIIAAYREGKTLTALADEFDVAYHTVHTLCRRFDAEGEGGLVPRYDRSGTRGLRLERLFYRAACFLKRRHRAWGAPFIRLQLEARYGGDGLPSVRTLQAWFKAAGLTPARSKKPEVARAWATDVHQVWQVDAKEQQHTADGASACWLTVTDEYSTAILAAPVFPPVPDQPGAAEDASAGTH